METQPVSTPMVASPAFSWGEQAAHWISLLLSPPLLSVTAVLLALFTAPNPPWGWGSLYLLFLVGAPLLYVGWEVQNGRISDLDVSVRAQRIRPLLMTLGGAAAGWILLHLVAAPRPFRLLATLNLAQIAIFLAITLSWKISMHCTAVSTFALFIWFLFGAAASPALLGVPLVAWSRVRLHRHTSAQTAAGWLLGGGLTLLFIWIYGG